MYEFKVANPYMRTILLRKDHCPKCDHIRTFRYVTHSGGHGLNKDGKTMALPSEATMWWRKQRDGKAASAPLDIVCKGTEW